MRFTKIITLLLVGLFIAAPCVAAPAITPEGARDLQARFAKELASRQDMKAAGMKAAYTGDAEVAAKGSYYQTTMPALKLTDTKNNIITIGRIVMNMMPTDNIDQWKTSVALPATMDYTDAKGKNSGIVTLGGQKASGLWDMKLFALTSLDADYTNAVFKNSRTKEGYSVSGLTVSYDMTKSDGGISGPVNVTAADLSTVDAGGKASVLSPLVKTKTQVRADKTAPNGYTQTTHAEVSGLTGTLNAIGAKMKDPSAIDRMQYQKAFGIISILQMSGKPVAGSPDVKSFDVVTDVSGRTLLNGVDIGLLMGAALIK